jgi:protein-disulfide isomerase
MQEETEIVMIKEVEAPEAEKTSAPLTVPHAIIWNALIIAAAILCAAMIIARGQFTGGERAADQKDQGSAVSVDIKNVKMEGAPYVGSATAKVAIAYWSDFQCPFCKQFETTTFQEIFKEYVVTGKAVVVFKDFSFLGPDSTTAALYSRAVWELYPEQYFTWREAMYVAQDAEHSGFGDEPSVLKLTGTISGIDAVKVQKQVLARGDAYQAMLDADRTEAVAMGIQGTPSVIMGTTLVPGVASFDSFKKLIDAELKKK